MLPFSLAQAEIALQQPKPHPWSVQTLKEAGAESGGEWGQFSRRKAGGNKTLKYSLEFPASKPMIPCKG